MTAKIRFATDILRRLGEELNPSIDQGILELVKNAYDADATSCVVDLTQATDGGRIVITDDGRGMTEQDILDGWLVLGKSRKRVETTTPGGRVPAGSKGLGRLAALRLGNVAVLESRAKDHPEIVATLNWTDFDGADMIDSVAVPVASREVSTPDTGTSISILQLRRGVTRTEVGRLARALILLADPFSESPRGFVPSLLTPPNMGDLAAMVENRYFNDAEYILHGELIDGFAQVTVTDWRGSVLWAAKHADIRGPRVGEVPYRAPDATFDFWAFLLNSSTFTARAASLTQVREWLKSYGGTHIYWNGLRVSPYGNPDDDWLDLNLRRARSPEERPSTNNSIGRLLVDDPTGRLEQTTDRGEFVVSDEFVDLRQFAIDCLGWLATRRLEAAEARRGAKRTTSDDSTDTGREAVKKVIEESDNASALSSAFETYDKARQSEADSLRREVQLYRTLSTAGITAATFAHESQGNALKTLEQSHSSLVHRTKKLPDFAARFQRPLDLMRSAMDAIGVLSSMTLRLVDKDKRRVERVDLNAVTRQVLDNFRPFLGGRDVALSISIPDEAAYLRGTQAAVESIVSNLLSNALTAFESVKVAQRNIEVLVSIAEVWELRVLDNGPGIKDVAVADIWLPGVSSRPAGSGLGLTIVRDAVRDLAGEVEAVSNGPLGGAEMIVRLPILEVEEA